MVDWGGALEALEDDAKPSFHSGLSPDCTASVAYEERMAVASDFYFRKEFDQAAKQCQAIAQFCKL